MLERNGKNEENYRNVFVHIAETKNLCLIGFVHHAEKRGTIMIGFVERAEVKTLIWAVRNDQM